MQCSSQAAQDGGPPPPGDGGEGVAGGDPAPAQPDSTRHHQQKQGENTEETQQSSHQHQPYLNSPDIGNTEPRNVGCLPSQSYTELPGPGHQQSGGGGDHCNNNSQQEQQLQQQQIQHQQQAGSVRRPQHPGQLLYPGRGVPVQHNYPSFYPGQGYHAPPAPPPPPHQASFPGNCFSFPPQQGGDQELDSGQELELSTELCEIAQCRRDGSLLTSVLFSCLLTKDSYL